MSKTGLLVLAHGSSNPDWVRLVEQAVANVTFAGPMEIGFLEMVEARSIPVALQSMEEQGVERIIVVPLFVSSGSTHIEELRTLLGVAEESLVSPDVTSLEVNAEIQFTAPMDDHPLIMELVHERVMELSTDPAEEVVVLVGHGSDLPGFRETWEQGLKQCAQHLLEQNAFAGATCAMTMDKHELRQRVAFLCTEYRVLVMPMFLSEGYFTRKVIPSRIEGLSNVNYSGRAFLPSPLIARWIEAMVAESI